MTKTSVFRSIVLLLTLSQICVACKSETQPSQLYGSWKLDIHASKMVEQSKQYAEKGNMSLVFSQDEFRLAPLGLTGTWKIEGDEIVIAPKEPLDNWIRLGLTKLDTERNVMPVTMKFDLTKGLITYQFPLRPSTLVFSRK